MKIINIKDIIRINNYLTKNNDYPQRLGGIYASLMYYNSIQDQISSIFKGIIKGHHFIDGNKRTSLIVYLILCKINNIEPKLKNNLTTDNIIINIAKNEYSVQKISSLIF